METQEQSADDELVSTIQRLGLMRGKLLPIQCRAIGAAQVGDGPLTIVLLDHSVFAADVTVGIVVGGVKFGKIPAVHIPFADRGRIRDVESVTYSAVPFDFEGCRRDRRFYRHGGDREGRSVGRRRGGIRLVYWDLVN